VFPYNSITILCLSLFCVLLIRFITHSFSFSLPKCFCTKGSSVELSAQDMKPHEDDTSSSIELSPRDNSQQQETQSSSKSRSSSSSSSSSQGEDEAAEAVAEPDRDELDDEMVIKDDVPEPESTDPAVVYQEQQQQQMTSSILEEAEEQDERRSSSAESADEGDKLKAPGSPIVHDQAVPLASSTPSKPMNASSSSSLSSNPSADEANHEVTDELDPELAVDREQFVHLSHVSATSMEVNVASEAEFHTEETLEEKIEEFAAPTSHQYMVVGGEEQQADILKPHDTVQKEVSSASSDDDELAVEQEPADVHSVNIEATGPATKGEICEAEPVCTASDEQQLAETPEIEREKEHQAAASPVPSPNHESSVSSPSPKGHSRKSSSSSSSSSSSTSSLPKQEAVGTGHESSVDHAQGTAKYKDN
jgi:hypothetical protein